MTADQLIIGAVMTAFVLVGILVLNAVTRPKGDL